MPTSRRGQWEPAAGCRGDRGAVHSLSLAVLGQPSPWEGKRNGTDRGLWFASAPSSPFPFLAGVHHAARSVNPLCRSASRNWPWMQVWIKRPIWRSKPAEREEERETHGRGGHRRSAASLWTVDWVGRISSTQFAPSCQYSMEPCALWVSMSMSMPTAHVSGSGVLVALSSHPHARFPRANLASKFF